MKSRRRHIKSSLDWMLFLQMVVLPFLLQSNPKHHLQVHHRILQPHCLKHGSFLKQFFLFFYIYIKDLHTQYIRGIFSSKLLENQKYSEVWGGVSYATFLILKYFAKFRGKWRKVCNWPWDPQAKLTPLLLKIIMFIHYNYL